MNPKVSSLLAVVPERVARLQSGALFSTQTCGCRHPERMALLARSLSWLTPLAALGPEEQRVLGLVNAAGRPVHAADLEEGEEGPAADAQSPESVQHVAA